MKITCALRKIQKKTIQKTNNLMKMSYRKKYNAADKFWSLTDVQMHDDPFFCQMAHLIKQASLYF